jgi:hypothetical protein
MIELAEDAMQSLRERDRINARLSQWDTGHDQQPHSPHSHKTDETAA